MKNFHYFKITFIPATVGLTAGLLIYGLLDTNLTNAKAIGMLVVKSFTVALITGLVLGILNVIFKVQKGKEKE
jgi:hypothetical protein